jgi:uncharacterized membrane protein
VLFLFRSDGLRSAPFDVVSAGYYTRSSGMVFRRILFYRDRQYQGILMAELVARERYTRGNALSLSLLNAAKLLGPFFGGLIVMLLNIKLLLYFTVLVYFLVAVCSYSIRSEVSAAADKKSSFLRNIKKASASLQRTRRSAHWQR